MGSLNDYNWREPERTHHRSLLKSRLLRQTVLSFVFFLLVATTIGADNLLGDGARYVAGQGINAQNSWLDFSDAVPAVADSENEANDVAEQSSAATPSGTEYPEQPLSFIAPASGVVVQDMALDSTGVTSDKGIIIRGAAGQDIMASAAGEIIYLGDCDSGYIVQISHEQGYISVYQGLTQLTVAADAKVEAGDIIGNSESGELLFSMTLDGAEVDPLEYLFADLP